MICVAVDERGGGQQDPVSKTDYDVGALPEYPTCGYCDEGVPEFSSVDEVWERAEDGPN